MNNKPKTNPKGSKVFTNSPFDILFNSNINIENIYNDEDIIYLELLYKYVCDFPEDINKVQSIINNNKDVFISYCMCTEKTNDIIFKLDYDTLTENMIQTICWRDIITLDLIKYYMKKGYNLHEHHIYCCIIRYCGCGKKIDDMLYYLIDNDNNKLVLNDEHPLILLCEYRHSFRIFKKILLNLISIGLTDNKNVILTAIIKRINPCKGIKYVRLLEENNLINYKNLDMIKKVFCDKKNPHKFIQNNIVFIKYLYNIKILSEYYILDCVQYDLELLRFFIDELNFDINIIIEDNHDYNLNMFDILLGNIHGDNDIDDKIDNIKYFLDKGLMPNNPNKLLELLNIDWVNDELIVYPTIQYLLESSIHSHE